MIFIEYRIPFGDTDQMGVVYYANYFRYFEMLRNELIRSSGKSYKQIEEENLMFPVLEAYCNYIYPAKYDDIIQVYGKLEEIEANRFKIIYKTYEKSSKKILVEGFTWHICISKDGKPRKLPEYIKSLIHK
jgi:acyl-CoA thioester hydrolase